MSKGSEESGRGGSMAPSPNGVVGYVQGVLPDKDEEYRARSGAVGLGGSMGFGVFGRGTNGLVGYEQSTGRDPVFEAQGGAGVVGRGPAGVRADGVSGPGVQARGTPGVHAEASKGPGLVAEGQAGVFARGRPGPGLVAVSSGDRGAVLSSRRTAQVWLIPLDDSMPTPAQLPGAASAGELLVTETVEGGGRRVATLWFCKVGGNADAAEWVKLA